MSDAVTMELMVGFMRAIVVAAYCASACGLDVVVTGRGRVNVETVENPVEILYLLMRAKESGAVFGFKAAND